MISNQSYTTYEDQPLAVTAANGLLRGSYDVDNNPLEVQSNSAPSFGTLTVQKDGSFLYVPNRDYNGWDSFTYVVTDNNGGAVGGVATIRISE